jgi:hypothetical protein
MEMLKNIDRITTHRKAGHDALNLAGGLAFQTSPQAALYKQVATSLWSGDGYYEKVGPWHDRFQANVAEVANVEAKFALQLAAFGRDFAGLSLRSSPVALYAEAALQDALKGTGLIREYAPKVLRRGDDPAKAVAYLRAFNGNIPHGVQRGIADVLATFDEYQLGKYKTTGDLRNMFRLARPKPENELEQVRYQSIVDGTIPIPYTWETQLSKAQGVEEKRAVWNELIASEKLGIFALMRNIRNMLQVGADIEEALEQITRERVTKSGILPFQWYKGYNAVQAFGGGHEIAKVFMDAIQWSLDGIEKLPGNTLVVADNSGSMDTHATRGMTNKEIANLMGAMAIAICEQGIGGTFGETWALAPTSPDQTLLENKWALDQTGQGTGHSTNAYKVIRSMTAEKVWIDRLVILTDEQLYDSKTAAFNKLIGSRIGMYGGRSVSGELDTYMQTVNPNVMVYMINLASNDNSSQFAPDQPVAVLAGWSDSIFRFMPAIEAGDDVLDHIRQGY